MGYSGGTTPDPTYRVLGDHAESIRIEYDPGVIDYTDLLDEFLSGHDVCEPFWNRQYMSAVFFHDEEQRLLASSRLANHPCPRGRTPSTVVEPAGQFFPAEDYHQKYYLRMHTPLFQELGAMYPEQHNLVLSTAAARINGYVAGYGSSSELRRVMDELGLSTPAATALLDLVLAKEAGRPEAACPLRL